MLAFYYLQLRFLILQQKFFLLLILSNTFKLKTQQIKTLHVNALLQSIYSTQESRD
jgi:hypothetical protein